MMIMTTRTLALAAASALALALAAAPAGAASNDYPDGAQYDDQSDNDQDMDDQSYDENAGDQDGDQDYDDTAANDEEIQVTAPRVQQRGEYGAPIRTVAMSRQVRFDDLDLGTPHGAHVLRARVRSTALTLCREIAFMHPVAAPGNEPCYPAAVQDAMAQADEAIASARGQAMNE